MERGCVHKGTSVVPCKGERVGRASTFGKGEGREEHRCAFISNPCRTSLKGVGNGSGIGKKLMIVIGAFSLLSRYCRESVLASFFFLGHDREGGCPLPPSSLRQAEKHPGDSLREKGH